MTDRNYEILAPAGSAEALFAAVHNGANAVYLGLDSFNARMKAENFTAENLGKYVDFCHLYGVKVYVTVNTSVKNGEFGDALSALKSAYENNADGVIVTDLALLKIAASLPKPFEVAASTQLNIHDGYGARFVKSLGATTVVAARESTMADVKEIVQTGLRTECFIQGALCVCQSGQCLFSSMVGGNSGNRGLCAQPCRKKYFHTFNGKRESGYFLSAKDLCGLDIAQRLQENGVQIFKIEGRNRRAEYAGATSDVYSRLFEGNFKHTERDRIVLEEMFNRGNYVGENYLCGNNGGIIYPATQGHIGTFVGKTRGNGFDAATEICKGDGLKIFKNGVEVAGGVALGGGTGHIAAEFSAKVPDGCEVRRTTSVALNSQVTGRCKKLGVFAEFTAVEGERVSLKLVCNGVEAVALGEVAPHAEKLPITEEEALAAISKTGNSPFEVTSAQCKVGNVFLAKSQLNALRRECLSALERKIIETYNEKFANRSADVFTPQAKRSDAPKGLAVVCTTAEEVRKASDLDADVIIYKPQFIDGKTFDGITAKCYLDLPSFANLNYVAMHLKEGVGIVAHNVGAVQFAREKGIGYIAGGGLNIFNDYMAEIFSDADAFFYSQELTLAETGRFANRCGYVFADGQITLMKFVHCPYKNVLGCTCGTCKADKPLVYVDEQGNSFEIRRRRDKICTFDLINGKKLSVANKLKVGGRYCVDFDERVVAHYKKLNDGTDDGYIETQPYTKGRLYNSVN